MVEGDDTEKRKREDIQRDDYRMQEKEEEGATKGWRWKREIVWGKMKQEESQRDDYIMQEKEEEEEARE